MVWSGLAGEIALGKVEDSDGRVSEAYTGPQVAWGMARGRVGSFGGKILNAWWMWTALSIIFFLGLFDRRRILSWHTADLLGLLSFGFSLLFFNRGHIFMSASLGALPLAYLVVRTSWIGFRGRACEPGALLARLAPRGACRLPRRAADRPQLRDAARGDRRRLAGVIGADRILDHHAPYGHMPDTTGRACGPADSDGAIRDHIQTNGRCESANAARRHVRADRLPRLRPRCAHARLVGQVGLAARRPRDLDRLRPARHPRPVPRRPALRRHTARHRARVRLGRVSLHRLRDELQLERHDHARDPRVGILALDLRRRPGCDDRARRAGRSSPRSCWRRSGSRIQTASARAPRRSSQSGSPSRRWPCSRSCCSSRA